jgi:hypothetical protein
MQGNEHQDLWKSQEEGSMDITINAVRAKARRYELESVIVHRVMLILTPLFVLGFGYNIAHLRQPWIVAGQVWTLLWFCGMAWKLLWKGPRRITPTEPCLVYLRREFQYKRQGLLWLRGRVWLLIPAIAASWWGGRTGAVPFIVTAVMLAFASFAFSHHANKVGRWLQELEP